MIQTVPSAVELNATLRSFYESFSRGKGRSFVLAKAIQAPVRPEPNVAFVILERCTNAIARKAVLTFEAIKSPLLQMPEIGGPANAATE
jgi:hypothetical protein